MKQFKSIKQLQKWIKENPDEQLIPSMKDGYDFKMAKEELPIWKEDDKFVFRGFSFDK